MSNNNNIISVISKLDFSIKSIEKYQLTQYGYLEYCIYRGNEPSFEMKYCKGLDLDGTYENYDICIGLFEMNSSEKEEVDFNEEYENKKRLFRNKQIMIKVPLIFVCGQYPSIASYCIAASQIKNDSNPMIWEVERDGNGVEIGIAYVDSINPAFQEILDANKDYFTILYFNELPNELVLS